VRRERRGAPPVRLDQAGPRPLSSAQRRAAALSLLKRLSYRLRKLYRCGASTKVLHGSFDDAQSSRLMRFSLQLSMVFPFDATRGNHLDQLVSFMGVRSFSFFLPLDRNLYTTTLLQMLCFQLMYNDPLRQYSLCLLGLLLYSSTAHGS
jgi:hypothetical protein